MAQSSPYRRESSPLLKEGHKLTEQEIARCKRIVTKANDPANMASVPPNMLQYAQLILAEAEHRHYQELLKGASEKELKELMDEGVLHSHAAVESEPLIGKAINNPKDIHFASKHFQ